ncbi:uroporphyrinogen-III C-methyltransferase [Iodobacter fluviatilis]|uniref:Uroporphyrin-3 C-methyltransferase n=1 Tax=Iodobacter fluviatilis TaxID=537 RepID=A0A377SU24_9NEIS|nr:uroporphyrinogen-III C-methyltransferase [Iodobacter fluviatilis]TCU82031.1 uroporphyrin-3 C-methyltransferase [Iodobacter fluviatilis]STR44875.1 Putative uroporphyrinogen-III C-methyltransferase [Iodobacter fluviatilis]
MTQDTSQDSLAAALQTPDRRFVPQTAIVLGSVALIATAGVWLYQQQAMEQFKLEVSRQLAANKNNTAEFSQQLASSAKLQEQFSAKLALLDAKQAESLSQQQALNNMYEALTHNETHRALSEIEQILGFASQQLQLGGNVNGALLALANIDQKLAQLNRPELISLRQSITRDIDTLKALPYVDIIGISAKLDSLIKGLEDLPLAIDGHRHVTPVVKPSASSTALAHFSDEIWQQLKQLIQIRRMDKPEAMLLSPEQSFFLRENIKLRLLDARTSLLLKDEASYRGDIAAALRYLEQYFDKKAPQTATSIATLKQLAAQDLAIQLPELGTSLAAVRSARTIAERAKQ